ncbi:hypothetical protein [Nocardioides kribbensis]
MTTTMTCSLLAGRGTVPVVCRGTVVTRLALTRLVPARLVLTRARARP